MVEKIREATHEKGVLKTCNNFSPNMSSLRDLYGAFRPNHPKYEFSKAKK